MATGSGKTFTAISFIYRLIKFAGARRVLFLVDRGNLARQTKKEFDQYASPYNNFKFGEEYIVQHLQSNQLDTSARVVICTIQRMFSMLKGRELPPEADEESTEGLENLFKEPEPIGYNAGIPIETFDIVVTDEAHRSIYNLWRQVLEYFDAYLIGLTATPNKQTFGFFNQNLVMEYGHAQAVADGVNVNYDVYRIKTEVTEAGAKVEKGYWLETLDKATRRKTAWQLDEDFEYDPTELDRAVQTPDQIRTVVRTLRDKWNVDLFPQRRGVAQDAGLRQGRQPRREDRRNPARGVRPRQRVRAEDHLPHHGHHARAADQGLSHRLLPAHRRDGGHDRHRHRHQAGGNRRLHAQREEPQLLRADEGPRRAHLQRHRPGAGEPRRARGQGPLRHRRCVGVCERDKTDSRPMDQRKAVPLDKLLQAVALGNVEDEVLSSVAARLARLDRDLDDADKAKVIEASGGHSLRDLARGIVEALNADSDGSPASVIAAQAAIQAAARPFADPALRTLVLQLRQKADQIIDIVTKDDIDLRHLRRRLRPCQGAGADLRSLHRPAQGRDHRPANPLQPPHARAAQVRRRQGPGRCAARAAAPDRRRRAVAGLRRDQDKSSVKGASQRRLLTDLVSLVRFAMHQDNELVPYPERVQANFKAWLAQARGKPFTPEQHHWLEMIRDHIAANLGIEIDDFEYAPFNTEGGLGRVHQLFGAELPKVIEELNREGREDEVELWQAYAALDKSRVKGASQRRLLTDLVSLVRFAMHQDNELVPYPERVQANFKAWLVQHAKPFTLEQQHWLEMIRDHIAANLGIEIDDFEYAPFNTEGGLGHVHQLFGAELPKVIEELNRELVA